MKRKIFILFILISFRAIGQNQISDSLAFTSRKGLYKINYNSQIWHQSPEKSIWDAEFQDSYNLIKAYFTEYDYFISDDKLKTNIKEQFKALGRIKDLKIYKKKINEIEVNYFDCELEYTGFKYNFQGFIYNGKGGSVELQFGFQKECGEQCQKLIDEFCSRIEILK